MLRRRTCYGSSESTPLVERASLLAVGLRVRAVRPIGRSSTGDSFEVIIGGRRRTGALRARSRWRFLCRTLRGRRGGGTGRGEGRENGVELGGPSCRTDEAREEPAAAAAAGDDDADADQ